MMQARGVIFYLVVLFACASKTKEYDVRAVKILGLPDSTLINFSYSLFPTGYNNEYIKSISVYDTSRTITEKLGPFTGLGFKEVLVSVPYRSRIGSFSKLFVVRIVDKEFEFLKEINIDCTKFSTIDIDNNGVYEIVTEYEAIYPGNLHYKIYEIISLANGHSEIVYQKYSEDGTKADNIHQRVAGDTVTTWITNSLIDLDKDSVLEMMEITERIKIEEYVSEDNIRFSKKIDTLIVRFPKPGV